MRKPVRISKVQARRAWIAAQKLDVREPFGAGPKAVRKAVEHLGYVQIDTINVIERCHHHILFNRIPDYSRADLHHAQSVDKSVFEYWTHALSYIPTRDIRFFLPAMKAHRAAPEKWFGAVSPGRMRRVMKTVRDNGPISIRDIEERRVEKDHEWASRKPSKRALELGFFNGRLAISARDGMVKSYDLIERHFGWDKPPRPATDKQILDYLLDRALRSQALVSLDSICHLDAARKGAILEVIERRVRARRLKPVSVQDDGTQYWAEPQVLDAPERDADPGRVHILSPFDPLIIQRKRTAALLGYDHVFEAYVPAAKRQFGYFTLPVLAGDEIVAALDLKADRQAKTLLVQAWHWVGPGDERAHRQAVETALHDFERFQFRDA